MSWPQIIKKSAVFLSGCALAVILYLLFLSRDLPSIEQLENYDPNLVTRIYSADGKVLHELYLEKRVFVSLDQIPEYMQDAVIASEDQRFRSHWGISLRDVLRAVVINTLSMSYTQGFSSLTQQLARNLYDTIGFKKTITRKLKEIITAIQIERTYTKDEILEMYLNSVHFGHGTYGVQAAAKRYFGKEARELTLDESALLVGVLPAPARYTPVRYPEKSLRRRDTVLKLMLNQKRITPAMYSEARAMSLETVLGEQSRGKAPYFTEYVRRILEKEDESLGINIYRDGLKIYTTLDSRLQEVAERAVSQSIELNQSKLNKRIFNDQEEFETLGYLSIFPEDTVRMMMEGNGELYKELRSQLLVQSAFVAIDSKTGAILAMIGGRPDYTDQFNRAVQAKRQPGSVFKPMVYATAIENGYTVTEQLQNQPVVLNVQNADGEWVKWKPRNYDNKTGGLTTMREGLRRSLNLISVRMVQKGLAPAQQVKKTAQRMGVSTDIRAVDAIALGTSEVYLLEMVGAYSIFSNKGVHNEPFAITRIEDRFGSVLKEYRPIKNEVLSSETSYMMTNLMQTVLDRGTGGSSRWKYHFYHPAAGKTGTTQGWTDAWFVGFSPFITAGVWTGVDDARVSLGKGQDGSKAALPVWARFMRDAHDTLGYKRVGFDRPESIIEMKICSITKLVPTEFCPLESTPEVFIENTQPTKTCKVHRGF
ncbi:MAG: PBP1A family penicillin-binding protein [Candidatus Marinimicrobia bacterium]|jgi:penicillin-binding protein 1A|nr:PBP1A family penicillin-binding protein [Candidatus Neomarinimicrobiota bacterium]MDP6790071.1 PBP1A family penicillin-binding protein [Candidatus Neomarinimicrobiota bacterium]MDP7071990.1 PBP1A family penicillin-binding protein [Candidatus Neomarinimicrobiota bacterium]